MRIQLRGRCESMWGVHERGPTGDDRRPQKELVVRHVFAPAPITVRAES